MADKSTRWPENVPGKFYVDERCIASKLCAAIAPAHFVVVSGRAHVYKQPSTPEEEAQCREAMRNCPVLAIGDDGD